MKTMQLTREVNVRRELQAVEGFLGHVSNLVRWTHFFHSVEEPLSVHSARMSTMIGPALTQIKTDKSPGQTHLLIDSLFAHGPETAALKLTDHQTFVSVAFTMNVPTNTSQSKKDSLMSQLDGELTDLKGILEAEGGHHAAW